MSLDIPIHNIPHLIDKYKKWVAIVIDLPENLSEFTEAPLPHIDTNLNGFL